MIKNITFLAEILRYENGLSVNQRSIENVLYPLISTTIKTPFIILSNEILKNIRNEIYESLQILPTKDSWVDIYITEPTKKIIDIVKKYFCDTLIICFELHPLLQKAFDASEIKYIKLMWNPIRYLDDIFFGMTSNVPEIHSKLLKYKTDSFIFKQHAGILKAESSVNVFVNRVNIKPNSCIFFAQTNRDCSLIYKNKMLNFFDFKDEFLEDIKYYDHVYFKIHPCEVNQKAVDFIKSLPNTTVLWPNDINFYDLISNDNIKKCFAISSGSLYEARFFGKDVKYYYKQPFDFVDDFKNKKYNISNTFIPIYKTFWQPTFWADILSIYFESKSNLPIVSEEYKNCLRYILKMTWGFYDSRSVSYYHIINSIRRDISNLRNCIETNLKIKSRNKTKIYKFLHFYWLRGKK